MRDTRKGDEGVRGVEVGVVRHRVYRAKEEHAAQRHECDSSYVGHLVVVDVVVASACSSCSSSWLAPQMATPTSSGAFPRIDDAYYAPNALQRFSVPYHNVASLLLQTPAQRTRIYTRIIARTSPQSPSIVQESAFVAWISSGSVFSHAQVRVC